MAHAIIEYSANLETRINLNNLVNEIHEACINTGVFPITGMRTRAACRDNYKIGDGNPDACFIHLLLKIGPGRSENAKKKAMESVFDALSTFVEPLYNVSPLALSIEIFELPLVLRINKHNLRDYISVTEAKGKEDA